jgi:diacylglycerol kinase
VNPVSLHPVFLKNSFYETKKSSMNTNKEGLEKRLKSFGYAFRGIVQLIRSEPNARIHLAATIIVLIAGLLLDISKSEWCVILIVIALVWAAEAFNTVIEKLTDYLFNEYHETARFAKDISAGAVLICSAAALVCGLIIFLPKLLC